MSFVMYMRLKKTGCRTMPCSDTTHDKKESCRFNGIGFGVNVLLRCHTDMDFILSTVQVHIDNQDYGVCITELYDVTKKV